MKQRIRLVNCRTRQKNTPRKMKKRKRVSARMKRD